MELAFAAQIRSIQSIVIGESADGNDQNGLLSFSFRGIFCAFETVVPVLWQGLDAHFSPFLVMDSSNNVAESPNMASSSTGEGSAQGLDSQFGGSALEELKLLGVQTFQASELENTVVRQMDERLEVQSMYRGSKELQKALADLENTKTQLSRLKAQCRRLSQQDQSEKEIKELYKECLAGYRARKAEKAELETQVKRIKASLDARVIRDRAERDEKQKENPAAFDFDLGMRTTTTEEQETIIAHQHEAHAAHITDPSSTEGTSSLPDTMDVDESEIQGRIGSLNAKRKHDDVTPSPAGSSTSAPTKAKKNADSASMSLPEPDEDDETAPSRGKAKGRNARTASPQKPSEDLDDEVEALLNEFQAPHNDDEDQQADEEEPDVPGQRVRRSALGDAGDEFHGGYVQRLEKWIDENRDDPRSKDIRKLRKWLAVRNKSLFRRAELTELEKQLLKPAMMPTRKASVAKGDHIPTVKFDGGFEIPRHLYKKLFEHQRVAVRWLWELHQQEAGGILGDEMGLGKTLETIAFLSGLAHSGLLTGPILIVCPTTVVSHWLREFHWWAPEFQVTTFRGAGESVPIAPALEQCVDVFESPNGFTHLYESLWKEITDSLDLEPRPDPPAKKSTKKATSKRTTSKAKKNQRFNLEDAFGVDVNDDEDGDVDIDGNEDVRPVEQVAASEPLAFDDSDEKKLLDDILGFKRKCVRPELNADVRASIDTVDGHTPVVLIMSYETVRMNIAEISRVQWHYAIMDEGHKLRNPDTAVTQACKRLPTPHRMLLSGTPIQNNLVELWSLFDFCFPGKLGTLETFEKHFAWPIQRGGYANASPMEVRVAYKCALTLRDLVNPYLLRRSKDQVNIKLPEKSEQILFCQITDKQRDAYKAFLRGSEAKAVYEGMRNMLYGVDILRKICNHVFLNDADHGKYALQQAQNLADMTEGSAKLKVLNHVLAQWRAQRHRVLIFTQTIQMLDIIERFLQFTDYPFIRMDGHTASGQRQKLVDRFNEADPEDPECPFIFLLTTRVGGLGINLTSANRVIVYDPDWNPMTDLQAKERAYRIGQTSSVIVYRLVTSGTIEEKIYHRQVFKQFLTQKILRDPKQTRSFFQSSGLRDLFKLNERSGGALHEDELTQVPREEMAVDESDDDDDEDGAGTGERRKRSKSSKSKKSKQGGGEGWLLSGLMGSELSSTLDHEAVMDKATGHSRAGSARSVESYVEQEAENLATKAVDMLRRSRATSSALGSSAQSSRVGSAVPKFGTVSRAGNLFGGAKSATPKVSGLGASTAQTGLSGSQLVQSLKDNSIHPLVETQAQLVTLKDFFLKLGGIASSQQIADFFRDRVPQKHMLLFRSLLRKVADFDANTRYWTLKPWAGGALPEGQEVL